MKHSQGVTYIYHPRPIVAKNVRSIAKSRGASSGVSHCKTINYRYLESLQKSFSHIFAYFYGFLIGKAHSTSFYNTVVYYFTTPKTTFHLWPLSAADFLDLHFQNTSTCSPQEWYSCENAFCNRAANAIFLSLIQFAAWSQNVDISIVIKDLGFLSR